MKKILLKVLRGSTTFRVSFKNHSLSDAYNTFPIHIAWIILCWTVVMIQEEWNLTGFISLSIIIIDLCLIAYRTGYADMRRSLQKEKLEHRFENELL